MNAQNVSTPRDTSMPFFVQDMILILRKLHMAVLSGKAY
jgi:hypothetical protein